MTIKDSNIIWQVFAEIIWIVSLRKVWEELKNYQFPWKKLSTKQCLINFVLALVMLYLSNFDVYSDGIVAYDYIAGAPYFYVLTNDTYHQEIIHLNCAVNNDTIQYNEFIGLYGWVSSTLRSLLNELLKSHPNERTFSWHSGFEGHRFLQVLSHFRGFEPHLRRYFLSEI